MARASSTVRPSSAEKTWSAATEDALCDPKWAVIKERNSVRRMKSDVTGRRSPAEPVAETAVSRSGRRAGHVR